MTEQCGYLISAQRVQIVAVSKEVPELDKKKQTSAEVLGVYRAGQLKNPTGKPEYTVFGGKRGLYGR